MDERKRDSIVAYLRRRMAEVGIGVDDIAAAIAEDKLRDRSARYRSATGDIWDGEGEMPQWLQQAISAGQSAEHFAVNHQRGPSDVKYSSVDWTQDPFAGTRLAMLNHASNELR